MHAQGGDSAGAAVREVAEERSEGDILPGRPAPAVQESAGGKEDNSGFAVLFSCGGMGAAL